MKINENIYPYNAEARKLPVHLTGIGGSEYQYHIIRNEGYHWHQILYSAGGSGILKYDNSAIVINEGDFFFLPAGYPHEYYTENSLWDVRWVAFDGYACAHILSQFSMTAPVIISPQNGSPLPKLYSKMFTVLKTDRSYCDYSCSGYIYAYILEFHKLMDTKANKQRNDRSRLLAPVLDYIDENYRSDFPLTVLAELAGVTPQHLCRVFKDSMNMRPNEYLTQRRLQEAKKAITEERAFRFRGSCSLRLSRCRLFQHGIQEARGSFSDRIQKAYWYKINHYLYKKISPEVHTSGLTS